MRGEEVCVAWGSVPCCSATSVIARIWAAGKTLLSEAGWIEVLWATDGWTGVVLGLSSLSPIYWAMS